MQLPADREIRKLSHGEADENGARQCLPFRPKLLVLDEPLSGLDPLARDEFMEGLLHQAGETTVVLSSHELAEIEHAVTHVGVPRLGEPAVSGVEQRARRRVREVRVLLEGEAAVPAPRPETWLDVRAAGNVLTFVETRYAEATLGERVRACVAGVRRIDAEPLPLRAIFVALARRRGLVRLLRPR